MPDLAVFGFVLALFMVDHAMRSGLEMRLIRIQARLRWLVWVVSLSVALSMASFAMLEGI